VSNNTKRQYSNIFWQLCALWNWMRGTHKCTCTGHEEEISYRTEVQKVTELSVRCTDANVCHSSVFNSLGNAGKKGTSSNINASITFITVLFSGRSGWVGSWNQFWILTEWPSRRVDGVILAIPFHSTGDATSGKLNRSAWRPRFDSYNICMLPMYGVECRHVARTKYEWQVRKNRTRSYMNGWTATANLWKRRTLFFT